jgi:hypothetical protein
MKTILTLAVFAILLALLGYLMVPLIPHGDSRPAAPAIAAWNPGAVHAELNAVQVREIDPNHATIVFSYDLDNQTDADYQMAKGPTTVIMTRLKADGTLTPNDSLHLDNSIFIPARNRTRISLSMTQPFRWPQGMALEHMGPVNQDKYRALLAQEVNGASGFVLFDQTAHYQIELPGAWQDLRVTPPGTGAGAGAANNGGTAGN